MQGGDEEVRPGEAEAFGLVEEFVAGEGAEGFDLAAEVFDGEGGGRRDEFGGEVGRDGRFDPAGAWWRGWRTGAGDRDGRKAFGSKGALLNRSELDVGDPELAEQFAEAGGNDQIASLAVRGAEEVAAVPGGSVDEEPLV